MKKWYQKNDNRWVTVADLADAIDANQNTVGHAIYKSKSNFFESRPSEEGGRTREYRLVKHEKSISAVMPRFSLSKPDVIVVPPKEKILTVPPEKGG